MKNNQKNAILLFIVVFFIGVALFKQHSNQSQEFPIIENPNDFPELPPPKLSDKFPEHSTYVGTWNTEKNRRLEGIMTCDVHYIGNKQWEGKFHGNWHGIDFSYDVEWEGSPQNVHGVAKISGDNYTWSGKINSKTFSGKFESNRYIGNFVLESKS